jgi:hypothetical protein
VAPVLGDEEASAVGPRRDEHVTELFAGRIGGVGGLEHG